jgi:hypothetical protein
MTISTNKKWEVQRRLEEIERHLYWTGSVGRNDLIDRFGISPQQASTDIKNYLALASSGVIFNGSSKRYQPTPAFTPILISPSVENYIDWAENINHPLEIVPRPHRTASAETLRDLSQAIHQKRSVTIHYRSMTQPKGGERKITPHSLVSNGSRYHVRAYCHKRKDFRDFVLGRIAATGELGTPGQGREHDEEWHTLVIVRIGTHPELTADQRVVIEEDYSMIDGEAQIKIRQALLFYLFNQLSLDGNELTRSAVSQQIVLLNPEVRQLVKV